jgi:hypothetical protein
VITSLVLRLAKWSLECAVISVGGLIMDTQSNLCGGMSITQERRNNYEKDCFNFICFDGIIMYRRGF